MLLKVVYVQALSKPLVPTMYLLKNYAADNMQVNPKCKKKIYHYLFQFFSFVSLSHLS